MALREARAEAAPRLAEAVREQLADLAMARAELRVELVEDHDGDPPADSCVIWLRANPGLPEAPARGDRLRGRALAGAAGPPRRRGGRRRRHLGARRGRRRHRRASPRRAVGARLRAFADGRQVIVITHLPQVAAMADAHYRLVKGLDADGRATTRIEPVEGDELVAELCRMLGAGAGRRRRPPPRRGAAGAARRLTPRRGRLRPGSASARRGRRSPRTSTRSGPRPPPRLTMASVASGPRSAATASQAASAPSTASLKIGSA